MPVKTGLISLFFLFTSLGYGKQAANRRLTIIPDYMPSQAVMLSDQIISEFWKTDVVRAIAEAGAKVWILVPDKNREVEIVAQLIEKTLLTNLFIQSHIRFFYINTSTLWVRDWSPFWAYELIDEKIDFWFIDYKYLVDDNRKFDAEFTKTFYQNLNMKIDPKAGNFKYLDLSIYMDGGDLLCSWKVCFLSEQVLQHNKNKYQKEDRIWGETDLLNALSQRFKQHFSSVAKMVGEKTGHIDTWAKFLNENTLVINELEEKTIRCANISDQNQLREVQRFLDEQANPLIKNSLAAKAKKFHDDLQIIRIPMPLPGKSYRSYANALIVNQHILVPKFINNYDLFVPKSDHAPNLCQAGGGEDTRLYKNFGYKDWCLIPEYEKKISQVFKQAGLTVRFIEFDDLVQADGTAHCISRQIPNLGFNWDFLVDTHMKSLPPQDNTPNRIY